MKYLISVLIFCFLFLYGCDPQQPVLPKPKPPVKTIDDGGTWEDPEPGKDVCESACNRLQKLGCEEGRPTKGGTPCYQVCKDNQLSEVTNLHPDCVATKHSCAQVQECFE